MTFLLTFYSKMATIKSIVCNYFKVKVVHMNLQAEIDSVIKETLLKLQKAGTLPEGNWLDNTKIEIPANRDFGDFALNAAMVAAKQCKTNPRNLATVILEALKELPQIKDATIAGPGFINLKLSDEVWDAALKAAILGGDHYGDSSIGNNEKVNVEFLSANPTGPIHVGHTRGAIYGDVLARLLRKNGFDVTTEYYINDYGHQVDILARSLFWRYEELLGRHQNESMPEGQYPGDYLIPVAEALKATDQDKWLDKPETEWLPYFKNAAINAMMELIKDNLKELGIIFDVYTSEKSLIDNHNLEHVLQLMDQKGLLYKGVLAKPQGESDTEEWESKPQLLFKATEFGDDSDRVVARSDGTTTYFASDIAYHYNKFQRGFKKQIDVWGADHGGYVKRIKSAVQAVTEGQATLEVLLCQIVNLEKDGKPFRMSKRAGNFILSSDILKEINADAFRLSILLKSANTQMTFDLSKAKATTKDNPVFYIQYAYARSNSVMRSYQENFGKSADELDLRGQSFLANATEAERNLVRTIAAYPTLIETAGQARAPHLIVAYLEDLAREFHSLWTIGAKTGERFVDKNNPEATNRKMILIRAVQNTLGNGLKTLGVTPQKKMEYQLDSDNETSH